MRHRPLGNTGLQLSEVAFGCGDNAGLMIAGSAQEQAAAVAHAVGLGITYFDTAAGYGTTQSETNLGPALKAAKAHPIICTKVEVTPEQTGDVAQAVIDSVEASLKRLQLEMVDIVEIHNSPVHQR
ncbi:MAG: aldo/keto reductase, partial [Dehalococcoidia bacterium]|nr:aldo/keto reductase [Dehalococcoidia bacterium]